MERRQRANLGFHPQRRRRFHLIDIKRLPLRLYRQVRALAGLVHQFVQVGTGVIAQGDAVQQVLPKRQQLRTQQVARAVFVLLDEAVVCQRVQQARGAALVNRQMLGDFSGAHAIARMLKQVQDLQAFRQRLDLSHSVISLCATSDVQHATPVAIYLTSRQLVDNYKTVLYLWQHLQITACFFGENALIWMGSEEAPMIQFTSFAFDNCSELTEK